MTRECIDPVQSHYKAYSFDYDRSLHTASTRAGSLLSDK